MEANISEREAAKIIGVSAITLQKMRKRGEISYNRIGRRIAYSPADVLEVLKRTRHQAVAG